MKGIKEAYFQFPNPLHNILFKWKLLLKEKILSFTECPFPKAPLFSRWFILFSFYLYHLLQPPSGCFYWIYLTEKKKKKKTRRPVTTIHHYIKTGKRKEARQIAIIKLPVHSFVVFVVLTAQLWAKFSLSLVVMWTVTVMTVYYCSSILLLLPFVIYFRLIFFI